LKNDLTNTIRLKPNFAYYREGKKKKQERGEKKVKDLGVRGGGIFFRGQGRAVGG